MQRLPNPVRQLGVPPACSFSGHLGRADPRQGVPPDPRPSARGQPSQPAAVPRRPARRHVHADYAWALPRGTVPLRQARPRARRAASPFSQHETSATSASLAPRVRGSVRGSEFVRHTQELPEMKLGASPAAAAVLLAALAMELGARLPGAAAGPGPGGPAGSREDDAIGGSSSLPSGDEGVLFTDSLQFSSADLARDSDASDTMSAGVCARAYVRSCAQRGMPERACARALTRPLRRPHPPHPRARQMSTRGTGRPRRARRRMRLGQRPALEQTRAARRETRRWRARRGRQWRMPAPRAWERAAVAYQRDPRPSARPGRRLRRRVASGVWRGDAASVLVHESARAHALVYCVPSCTHACVLARSCVRAHALAC